MRPGCDTYLSDTRAAAFCCAACMPLDDSIQHRLCLKPESIVISSRVLLLDDRSSILSTATTALERFAFASRAFSGIAPRSSTAIVMAEHVIVYPASRAQAKASGDRRNALGAEISSLGMDASASANGVTYVDHTIHTESSGEGLNIQISVPKAGPQP